MSYPLPFPFAPGIPGMLDLAWRIWLWVVLVALALAALSGCTANRSLPPPPPPVQKVLVPVTQPCEVRKVDPSPLPSAGGVPSDIYEAVKRVLADRSTLLADREKLQAANSDPCPE